MNRIKLKVRNLKRVKFFIPECMEFAAVAYGETMGLDFTKAFSRGWYFNLKDKRLSKICRLGDCIEEKIIFNREYQEYNGVQFDFIDVQDVDELLKVIDANLANNLPTIIHMDTYYSYWGFLYQKFILPIWRWQWQLIQMNIKCGSLIRNFQRNRFL